MHEMIARLNIEHLRQVLARETDAAKQSTIMRLLAEEQAKLAAILEAEKRRA